MPAPVVVPLDWPSLPDGALLALRLSDLRLSLEASPDLAARGAQLHAELAARGFEQFRPHLYLGDEWFSPEGVPAIAVPFYLAHPRLTALERSIMLDVEGDTPEWCMRLLRHEAGHCFDHAYGFSKRKKWRKIFGSPAQEYHPETYRPRPYSRSFVRNLDNWYAQAHPDEDFAETFAVWLDPARDWRREYARWPVARQKLEYVDELAREAAAKPMLGRPGWRPGRGDLPCDASRLRTTLERYYARRRRENAADYPDFYDRDLRRIFSGTPPERGRRESAREAAREAAREVRSGSAARFMARHRKRLLESVSTWTGERKFPIERLVRKLTERCEKLDLRLGRDESDTQVEVAAYLATLVTHYLFTGKFKRTV
jgi:hypothetical protein